jgi:hypothetical protein
LVVDVEVGRSLLCHQVTASAVRGTVQCSAVQPVSPNHVVGAVLVL